MPRNPRSAGVAYHITQGDFDRQSVFFSRSDRDTYLSLIADNLEETQTRAATGAAPGGPPKAIRESGNQGRSGLVPFRYSKTVQVQADTFSPFLQFLLVQFQADTFSNLSSTCDGIEQTHRPAERETCL